MISGGMAYHKARREEVANLFSAEMLVAGLPFEDPESVFYIIFFVYKRDRPENSAFDRAFSGSKTTP